MPLVFILFVLVLSISFICSFLEAVLLSVTPTYIAQLIKDGKRAGLMLERFKDNINRPISVILTLNTVSHTAGSAAIGALVSQQFGNTGLTIVSIILTILIVVFSEFFPKVLGATYWRQMAPLAAYLIQFLITFMYVIVWLSEKMSRLVKPSDENEMTREEVITAAEIGVEDGNLHKKESAIIKNLLMLDAVFVADIMTPRSVVFALEATETVQEVSDKFKPIRFSRIPVFTDSLDHIIGMTHRYKILESMSQDQHTKQIRDLMVPIDSIPEKMSVAQVIDYFIKQKSHLALAVDDYGVTTGLVSLEDAIETLLGVEIVDEFDHIADMRQYALEQWNQRKLQIKRS